MEPAEIIRPQYFTPDERIGDIEFRMVAMKMHKPGTPVQLPDYSPREFEGVSSQTCIDYFFAKAKFLSDKVTAKDVEFFRNVLQKEEKAGRKVALSQEQQKLIGSLLKNLPVGDPLRIELIKLFNLVVPLPTAKAKNAVQQILKEEIKAAKQGPIAKQEKKAAKKGGFNIGEALSNLFQKIFGPSVPKSAEDLAKLLEIKEEKGPLKDALNNIIKQKPKILKEDEVTKILEKSKKGKNPIVFYFAQDPKNNKLQLMAAITVYPKPVQKGQPKIFKPQYKLFQVTQANVVGLTASHSFTPIAVR